MPELPTAKFVQFLLEESEEIVLMEAMYEYRLALSEKPDTLENKFKDDATYSLLLKMEQLLYAKKEMTP